VKNLNQTGRHITQSAPFALLLIALISGVILWLIVSGVQIPLFFSLIGVTVVAVYFGINFEKNYIPFAVVIILPLALFITAVPNLKACELVIPGLFLFFILRTMISRERGPGFKMVPLVIIIFFLLGFASYLRHPGLPTQLFARSVDLGNFRRYWSFFLGIMTYILAFYLFKRERIRKEFFLVKLLIWLYVGGLLLHLAMTYLRVSVLTGFFLVDWGPVPEGAAPGSIVFRGWTFGWYGLHLFLILMSFSGFPKNKFVKGVLYLLAFTCIILSGARATLLAAAFCAIMVCILRKSYFRLVIPLVAVTLIMALSYSFPQVINSLPKPCQRIFTIFPSSRIYGHKEATTSALSRLIWWEEAFGIISRNPYLGIGFEKVGRKSLYLAYAEYAVKIGASHSAYIATGVMLGIPGIAVLLWLFVLHLKRGIILFYRASGVLEKEMNLWLAIVLFSFNIIFLFAGSPQNLFRYLMYAGLINLNWYVFTEKTMEPSVASAYSPQDSPEGLRGSVPPSEKSIPPSVVHTS
jgi:O-Antigen ligase